jgi:branched-chain amino acid transport system permease protein
MDAFLHQVFAGLATGCIYGSIALALVMIHQATHHLNFAQGELATFSTFVAWALVQAGWPYWAAFALTVLVSFVAGMAIQRLLLRQFEQAPVLTNVAVFVGLLLIVNALAGWIFDFTVKSFPSPFAQESPLRTRYFSAHEAGSFLVMMAVLALLYAFFRWTPIGLAMRAAAQNAESARLVGIRVAWMLAIGWGLAAAIGAVAGMMIAPVVFLDPNMMSGILLYGFAAALLGGVDNPWGAVAGGLIIGVLENLLGAYVIGTELKLTMALVFIVGTLTLMPAGLFGHRVVTRV